ncbi:hypothetical protein BGX26_000553 [Mortierella sp. AD094]|nr:hypothetical protein BGX26_000553 [Mortierella sp. AD094]
MVWETCIVDNQDAPSPISPDSITTHAHHIRTLIYRGLAPPHYLSIQFLNLQALKIQGGTLSFAAAGKGGDGRVVLERMWSGVAALIRNCPTLTTIHLSTNRSVLTNEIWDAIRKNTNTRALQLSNIKIDWRQAIDFWRVCTALERLEMDTCFFEIPLHFRDSLSELSETFPRIRELKFNDLRIHPHYQYELIARCPELRSLSWRGKRTRPFPMQELHISISCFNLFSNLDSLDVAGSSMQDPDIYLAIKYMQKPIKKLGLSRSQFGPWSFEALELHFHTLQELDLTDCRNVKSKEIASILRSCPLLIYFKAGTLSSLDVEDYDPWACANRLLTLHLYIEVEESEVERASRRVFNCLSALTSLQELNIAGRGRNKRSSLQKAKPLQLRLDCGLAYLSKLWHMKKFYFGERGQEMTMDEGKWIKEHWRMLQSIQGRFNKNSIVNSQIQELFQEANHRHSRREPEE